MVDVRKAAGDTLEYHKVTLLLNLVKFKISVLDFAIQVVIISLLFFLGLDSFLPNYATLHSLLIDVFGLQFTNNMI